MDLIALRVNAGYSRDELAAKLGIGRETIRLAESGWLPTPRIQYKLAVNFGKKPLDLWPIEQQRRPR